MPYEELPREGLPLDSYVKNPVGDIDRPVGMDGFVL